MTHAILHPSSRVCLRLCQLWEEFPFCDLSGVVPAMSSVDFAYSKMYSVLVKLVDPFHLFWPDLTLTFTAIHFITEGRIMY